MSGLLVSCSAVRDNNPVALRIASGKVELSNVCDAVANVASNAACRRVAMACELLLKDFFAVPDMKALVRALGTNHNTLTKDFHSVHGVSPYSWLRRQKMLQARQLLLATDWPVSRVADAIGYVDANHFSTAYRKCFGLSPRQQRQPLQENHRNSEDNEDCSEACKESGGAA